MSINTKEMSIEREKLHQTNLWLDNQINLIKKDDDKLKAKLVEFKKKSRGKYNYEYENISKLYELISKKFKDYISTKSQIYFARIDFKEELRDKETIYIGKIGLYDKENGDEIVIDWRTPIADLYYSSTQGSASYKSPFGEVYGELYLKRKFIIKDRVLKDAFDDEINQIILKSNNNPDEQEGLTDEFLKVMLEEGVSSKLKDVVATIQKEQNDIIRADKNKPLIIQGSAGSGKTTVALHRLAYLLYRYKKNLNASDILVLAPNKLFLDYMGEVLPNLGVDNVKQTTFEDITCKILEISSKIFTKEEKLSKVLENNENESKLIATISKFKGSLIFKSIIDNYVKYIQLEGIKYTDLTINNMVFVKAKEIKKLFVKELAYLSLNRRKEEITRYLLARLERDISIFFNQIDTLYKNLIQEAKAVIKDETRLRQRIIELYDERDEKKRNIKNEGKKEIKKYFEKWKLNDIKYLYYNLFENEQVFDRITNCKIPSKFYDYMKIEIHYNLKNNIIDSDDLAGMMYLKFKIDGLENHYKYRYIVADEAQDYSMLQFYVIKNLTYENSFTIVGDIGQSIYYYKAINNWSELIQKVYAGNAEYMPLTQSYRSTVEIVNFANKVLKKQKNDIKVAKPVLRHGVDPMIMEFNYDDQFAKMVDKIVDKVINMGKKNTAIIGRTIKECIHIEKILKKYSENKWIIIKNNNSSINFGNIIIPSYMTKGLEFDCSVIYNCNNINYGESETEKKLLYVVLTRALHLEYIFYNGEISNLLS